MATRLISTAKWATEKERLSTLPQLEKASRTLARVAEVLFEELELVETHGADLDPAAPWAAVEEVAPRETVMGAAALVVSLVPEDEDSADVAMRAALTTRYNTVRPFLALLGESKALAASTDGARVLAGVKRLPALARRRVKDKSLLPREVDDKLVPAAWRKAVYANPDLPQGAVDPGRVRGVRAGAAAPGPEQPRHVRLPLAPVVRPARPAPGRCGVGRGVRGHAGRAEPGHARR